MKALPVQLFLTSLACCFFGQSLLAQMGVSFGYKTLEASSYTALEGTDPYPATGYELGVDYWFRLKKRRIEFMPALGVSRLEGETGFSKVSHDQLAFHFNTNIYPFDLKSDCNCPTWSKDGNFITKGLFLQLSPGFLVMKNKVGTEFQDYEGTSKKLGGSIGVGIDIGLSDFLTVSPIVRYSFYQNADLGLNSPTDQVSDLRFFFAGLRVGMRWDELNKYGYRPGRG